MHCSERTQSVGSWVLGGSVGRDQLAMAAKVRRHWFNPCRLGSRGHLGADFSLLLYTDLIKKRKPSRYFTDEGELIRDVSIILKVMLSFHRNNHKPTTQQQGTCDKAHVTCRHVVVMSLAGPCRQQHTRK